MLPSGKHALISDDVTTTIAAQLATLPIILANFGQYNLLLILVNALVLWMIPVLMVCETIGTVLGMVIVPPGQGFLYLSLPFLIFLQPFSL